MKINLDLRYSLNYGGISNYIRSIASNLDLSMIDFWGCNFWHHNRSREKYSWFKGRLNQSILPDKLINNSKLILPLSYELAVNSIADANLFLTYRLPKLKFKKPVIATIHDIILLMARSEHQCIIDEHEAILKRTVDKSEFLLTVSEASKKDIIDYFNVSPDRITIVHNGIDYDNLSSPVSYRDMEFIRHKYNLPRHFILNFGACRNHKNIERLIKAYALLPRFVQDEYKLVLTQSNQSINKLIEDLCITENTYKIGFVDECDKKAIYQIADIVYYASLYEGFGVPIIEAQACGTPVLTSTTSSLPEAAGGAAVLVDPYDIDAITDGLLRLIEDTELRQTLIKAGQINAKKYTWQQSVKELEQALLLNL